MIHAKHYITGDPLQIQIELGRITAVKPSAEPATQWIAPSFFDVQINGALGLAFTSPHFKAEDVRTVAMKCRAHGIGRFFPTVITASRETISHCFQVLSSALEQDAELAKWIPGFHLEGPYLCSEDGPRGAHPREHARDPNWDEYQRWQDIAGGRIRMVTVAPERAGCLPFIEQLANDGIVVAIGHTNANARLLREAVQAGARTSTHLGNGCHAVLPRHENVIWEQAANDDLWASLITDGHHLPPSVMKSLIRAKGMERTLITCDASSLAGLPPGRYPDWGKELEVLPGGKIIVPGTPYLAGSGCFTDQCVSRVMQLAGLRLPDAVSLASVRPRQLMRLSVPQFAVGEQAEFVLFDWQPGGDLKVNRVVG